MNFFQKNCSIFYCTFESFAPHGGPRCDKFLSLQQYFLFCLYLEFSGWFWTQVRGVMQATVLILHHSENAVQFSFFPHTSLQWVMHGHSQANVSLPMYLQLIKGNDDSCCDHRYDYSTYSGSKRDHGSKTDFLLAHQEPWPTDFSSDYPPGSTKINLTWSL